MRGEEESGDGEQRGESPEIDDPPPNPLQIAGRRSKQNEIRILWARPGRPI